MCTSACGWVCVGLAVGGEVSVKSVLFSPVGWIRSLQICTTRYCDRGHSCRRRRCSLQRRVSGRGAWGAASPGPPGCRTAFLLTVSGTPLGPPWARDAQGLPRALCSAPSCSLSSIFAFDHSLPLSHPHLLSFPFDRSTLGFFRVIAFGSRNGQASVLPVP